ncbi:hypothetical protein OAU06_03490 [Acidimicrobiia bacterium]|nr:hypothetical protein [Acidimicrobiia bacterium]
MQSIFFYFCGVEPPNFIKVQPNDSSFVFINDINFKALNLNNFFGKFVTVNSYSECYYYAELGFEPNKVTIFDYGLIVLSLFLLLIVLFLIFKYDFGKKISFYLKYIYSKFSSFFKEKKIYQSWLIALFIVQIFFLFDYVRTKASRIPRFTDEYISLASNFNFFTTLDFNAGEFIGGSYSEFLTSGPISAIGGVVGWMASNNLTVARIANFYWLVLLQITLLFFISKSIKKDFLFLLVLSNLVLILIPWWQGSLYMIGEFASVIIFTNAVFLFYKYRNAAMILFSIAIFWGKFLTLLPFIVFYVLTVFRKINFSRISKDIVVFFIPLILWLILVDIHYEDGGFIVYLNNLLDVILGHQSAGIESGGMKGIISGSEVSIWNNYDIFRILIAPLISIIILISSRTKIGPIFGQIALPLSISIFSIYLWFWLLSPTKWMRYSQHFMIVILISIVYLIGFNLINSKISYFLAVNLIAVMIEGNKDSIYIFLISSLWIVFVQRKFNYKLATNGLLVLLIVFEVSLPYFQKTTFGDLSFIINACESNLISEECLNAYENK